MNLAQIKSALEAGLIVHWMNPAYTVIKDHIGQCLIGYCNENFVGLTHADGVTLNGKESEFYIRDADCPGWQCHISQNDKGVYRFEISRLAHKGIISTIISPDASGLNDLYRSYVGYRPCDAYPNMTESDISVLVAGVILFDFGITRCAA